MKEKSLTMLRPLVELESSSPRGGSIVSWHNKLLCRLAAINREVEDHQKRLHQHSSGKGVLNALIFSYLVRW